jgi:hypothetical protein
MLFCAELKKTTVFCWEKFGAFGSKGLNDLP